MRALIGGDLPGDQDLTDDDLERLYAVPSTPWMRVNMVSTVDGSATGAEGLSKSLNNDADGRVFDILRRLADVLIVGAGTVAKEQYEVPEKPIVLVSRKAQVPPSLRDAPEGRVLMATCSSSDGLDKARELLGADNVMTLGSHRVDLALLKRTLADRGWTHQLSEGGPHLLRDLVHQDAADELTATWVPRLVAGDYPRITEGAPIDKELELTLLLEDRGTLLGRWRIAGSAPEPIV